MDYSFLAILAVAFGAMWLMTSRTRKQQKAAADFRANLAPGQEVMTGSGLFATVVDIEDDIVTLETSPGVTSRWLRPAIAKLVEPPVTDEDADEEAADEEGTPGLLEDNSPELQVPDDASSLTDRDDRTDEGGTTRA